MFLSLCMITAGCGQSSTSNEVTASGEVKLDGAPVETGRILFRELEGGQQGFSGEIKNGQYSLKCSPGKMRVEITASRIIPGKFDNSNGTPEPVGEMYIPKKYNENSELTAEVKAGEKNNFPFELTSK